MKRRDDPFERDSFWPDGDFNVASSSASSMVEDLNARRDYFLRGRGGGSSSSTTSAFSDLGAFSSVAPSTSTSFPYSQKNFHISDGNLYSVLSPFQARKSSARPAFLRGQSCVTSTSITNSNASSGSIGSSSCSITVGQRQQPQEQGLNRRSKLKFHHQDMPPPYGERSRRHPRGKMRQSDGENDPLGGDSSAASWCESAFDEDPFARLRSDEDFLFSKRLKSPHREHFQRTREEECESDEVRHRLFRESEWNSEDISRSFRHHRIRRSNRSCASRCSSTAFSTSAAGAEDDEAGPLNLCLADYRQKLESRIKNDFESDCESHTLDDAESDTEGFPFHQWSNERKFGLSDLFNGFNSYSKFQRGDDGSSNERSRTCFEDEPRVLDLSTKERAAKSATLGPSSHFVSASPLGEMGRAEPFYVQNCQMPPTEAEIKSKKFAPISEMLENMKLQDADDFRHNALKRYLSARERLMHTHPEMFGGWERETAAGETEKPYDMGRQPFVPNKDTLDVYPKAPDRPRSWDVTPSSSSRLSNAPATPEPSAQSRPESAEPCLESSPFAPDADISFTVEEAPQSKPKRMVNETSYVAVGAEARGAPAPSGPVLCSSCPEVPSLGATAYHATKLKHHPKMKIKSEGAIGTAAQRTKARQLRKSSSGSTAESHSSQFTNQDISICKFKLTKGVHPVLEEKKSFFVPMLRPPTGQAPQPPPKFDEGASCSGMPNPPFATASRFSNAPSTAATADKFRTFKIHVGSQEEMGRKLTCGKRLRRRSQKALVREKLEATFREQGFLIKTQQVSSAEGAVYCKFRQLKKFTRYLYKSWKDHLPKELDDISKTQMQAKEAKLTK